MIFTELEKGGHGVQSGELEGAKQPIKKESRLKALCELATTHTSPLGSMMDCK